MEDDVATIEEDIDEGLAEGSGDETASSQVDDLLEQWESKWTADDSTSLDSNTVLENETPAEGVETNQDGIAKVEVDQENSQKEIFDKVSSDKAAETVPLEIVQQFGVGEWSKTYQERGESTFDFQTGEMMSKDGNTSLTRQIKDGATAEQAALHEQVIQGWLENFGGAQTIAFIEDLENGMIIHVTSSWVEFDGQVASETWSREILKEELQSVSSGLVEVESSIGDYDDDLLPDQNIAIGEGSVSLTVELVAGNQEAAKAEVATSEVPLETAGIELQDMDDGDLESGGIVKVSIEAEVVITPDENLSLAENSLSFEQSPDLKAAIETDDYDDEAVRAGISQADNTLKTVETAGIDPKSDFLAQRPALQVREISTAQQEQTELIQFSQAEIIAAADPLEGISLIEDSFDLDDDFEIAVARAEVGTLRLGNETLIEAIDVPSPRDAVAVARKDTSGIELFDISNEDEDLEEAVMPMSIAEMVLESALQQPPVEPAETAGIVLLDDVEIQSMELTREALELKSGIDKADEVAARATSWEAILPARDILKSQVPEPKAAEIEVEEMLQTNKDVKWHPPIIRAVKEERPEAALKQPPTLTEKMSEAHEAMLGATSEDETIAYVEAVEITIATPTSAESSTEAVKAELGAAQNRVVEKDNRMLDPEPVTEKVATAKRPIEFKPIPLRQQVKIDPTFLIEQSLNALKPKLNTLKLNQKIPQAAVLGQTSKPITVRFSQKAPLPFRSAELINKILTFKPTGVAGDEEETANNTVKAYKPEFELAA